LQNTRASARGNRDLACENLGARRRPDPDHPALFVGHEAAFGLVQQSEFVTKWVANARAAADRNVEWVLNCLAARVQESREGLVNIFNDNIGFGADLQVNDELCIGVRKAEPDRFVASPQDSMPEAVTVKGYRRIEIGDAEEKVVEPSKQGPTGDHD
jgi:hypothetical protein